MAEEDEKPDPELTDRIRELESLVGKNPARDGVSVTGKQAIPILDELVTPEDYGEPEEDNPETGGMEHRFDDIADRVEQKLSAELDDIVKLLKVNLKDSIMHELHDQIKKEPGKKPGS